jgi:hypothetical protein
MRPSLIVIGARNLDEYAMDIQSLHQEEVLPWFQLSHGYLL